MPGGSSRWSAADRGAGTEVPLRWQSVWATSGSMWSLWAGWRTLRAHRVTAAHAKRVAVDDHMWAVKVLALRDAMPSAQQSGPVR